MYNRQAMKRALLARDWATVCGLLAATDSEPADVNAALLEDTLHSGCLIEQREDKARTAERNALVIQLREQFARTNDGYNAGEFEKHLKDVEIIDRCYREIRESLAASPIGERTPQEQAWAAVYRLIGEIRYLHEEIDQAMKKRAPKTVVWFLDSNPWQLKGKTGKPIDPDAVLPGLARHLGLTLLMLAHENGWFCGKRIVLPMRTDVDEQLVFESGVNSLLAHCWAKVQDGSEHVRFFGDGVSQTRRMFKASNQDTPPFEADLVRFDLDLTLQRWEVIARSRLSQLTLHTFMNLKDTDELKSRIKNVRSDSVAPAPENFVSEHEMLTLVLFEMVYHLSPRELSTEHDGLTLFEWIRSYSILRLYCNCGEIEPLLDLYELDPREFAQTLQRGALSSEKAHRFTESIMFQQGKRDLYDAPVIEDAGGRRWLLAPLFASAIVSQIVLSQLGSREISFETKGSVFEKDIMSLFESSGVPAKGFKYIHDGKQFQCDAAVLWGKHLFVFECKNDLLPTSRPMLSYFFWLDMLKAANQVTKIASHLEEDRSHIRRHFNRDDWEAIHPIVLSAMPFSLPGRANGAYFYDASALVRFLTEGTIGVVAQYPDPQPSVQIQTSNLWSGDTPSPEDLLCQLENPVQLLRFEGKIGDDSTRIGISPGLVVETPLIRAKAITLETILTDLGQSETQIEALKEAISRFNVSTEIPSD
jgi:hypothetical protein